MTDQATLTTTSPPETARAPRRSWRDLVTAAEIDTRLIGMLVALAVIWIGFDLLSGHKFITSRNLWNLSVQSTSIAIMATGMVLIIVTRNIDLSVGSLLGFLGYTMALMQTDGLVSIFGLNLTVSGLGANHWWSWLVILAIGMLIGALIGLIQGYIVAYIGVPAFIVTLGGFLAWRGLIFRTGDKQGQTLAPLDETFRYLGGAPDRSLGPGWTWVVAVLACAGIAWTIASARRQRDRYGLTVRPAAVDVGLVVVGCAMVILGVALVANRYPSPTTGDAVGLAYPVLILAGVTVGMSYLARRRRFGRYVYAYGGNPEAAELGGINTRRLIVYTFMLMGVLTSLSAAIQTARLNSATTNLGIQNELDVIAATVIGGASFSGGIGTIPGAVLGAVVMQSLRSGMSLLNIDSPAQDIVVAIVLVTAVAVDALLRERRRGTVIGALAVGVFLAGVIIQTGRP